MPCRNACPRSESSDPERDMFRVDRTVVFGEFQCQGGGADMRGRVPWLKHFSYEEARPFLDRKFIQGEDWLRL